MPEYYVGLMSGTSLDGIDAVLADFAVRPPRLTATLHRPYPPPLRDLLLEAAEGAPDAERVGVLDARLGELYGDTVNRLLQQAGVRPDKVEAVGSHGHTLRHRPDADPPFSLQIGDPARIAETTGLTTVADFRRRDIAAGGQGAPLVPRFHQYLFARAGESRAVLNVGGMANLTHLPGDARPVTGFDTGPGNVLMDAWCREQLGQDFDRDGAWAAGGRVIGTLLDRLLADDYFDRAPPKSTGREHFNRAWLDRHLAAAGQPARPADVQATLLELTARSIADALLRHAGDVRRLVVCGGGAHNTRLMQRLQALLPCPVEGSAAHGVDPDWVEALAFAWLARQALAGRPGNLPAVTGARREVVLGAIHAAGRTPSSGVTGSG